MQKLFLIMCLYALAACAVKTLPKDSKALLEDSFYDKTRFIMTKDEMEIFKHLPDSEAQKEFMDEFWKKRDPDPATEENENKLEYEKRIEYANQWFKESRFKDRGWDSERGRILLQLGFPDERQYGELPVTDRFGSLVSTKTVPMEEWLYFRYHLELVFVDKDGLGEFTLYKYPATLLTAIDLAKFTLDLSKKGSEKSFLSFQTSYHGDKLLLTIPVNKISFNEKDGAMSTEFELTVYVYLNYRKIDTLDESRPISGSKEELLKANNITLEIPYILKEKGSYTFDVIVKDKFLGTRSRSSCKYKL